MQKKLIIEQKDWIPATINRIPGWTDWVHSFPELKDVIYENYTHLTVCGSKGNFVYIQEFELIHENAFYYNGNKMLKVKLIESRIKHK